VDAATYQPRDAEGIDCLYFGMAHARRHHGIYRLPLVSPWRMGLSEIRGRKGDRQRSDLHRRTVNLTRAPLPPPNESRLRT